MIHIAHGLAYLQLHRFHWGLGGRVVQPGHQAVIGRLGLEAGRLRQVAGPLKRLFPRNPIKIVQTMVSRQDESVS